MKKFLIYKNEFENQLNKKIRTDKECEYDWSILNACCNNHDINHEVKPPYSSKSNGVTERKNISLKNMVNAMLISYGALLNFLGREIMLSACHIQNRILYKKKTRKTSYGLWRDYKPNLSYLKMWGCLAKVLKTY